MRQRFALLVAAVSTITWTVVGLPGQSVGSTGEADQCRIDDGRSLMAGGKPSAEDGLYDDERWLHEPAAQENKTAIDAVLLERFGRSTKTDKYVTLSKGLIGAAPDYVARQLVVVIDPSKVEAGELESHLREAAERDYAQRAERASAPMSVRVQSGCHTSDELIQAGKVIDSRAWHPDAKTTGYFRMFDSRISAYRLFFSPKDEAVAQSLQKQLGDRVVVDLSGAAERNKYRNNDTQPHWGGARIWRSGVPAVYCSSGFAVDTVSAGKAFVTAGHCFNNGHVVVSGSSAYGTAQLESNYPQFDMILLNGNVNYDDDIFHAQNPAANDTAPVDVIGGTDPTWGTSVCQSGATTGRICNATVTDPFGGEVCEEYDPDVGCTPGLFVYERLGTVVCQGGDSGSPIYTRNTANTTALVRGIHIGSPEGAGDDICAGELVSNIQDHLDVDVAISP